MDTTCSTCTVVPLAHDETVVFCEKVLEPLAKALRLGDADTPNMGLVYETMMNLDTEIMNAVQALPDVEAGGVFDHGRLKPLEDIIEERWKYLHCPYHSVGFMLHPKNHAIDLNAEAMEPYIEELRADFMTVCSRIFKGDATKAAKALKEFNEYKRPEYMQGMEGNIRKEGILISQPWEYFDAYIHDKPNLGKVARHVLSKQVGVGAVERSHKVMKNVTFDKTRARMEPMKADRDLYTNLNTRALRKTEETNVPDWVQFYSEEIDENVAETIRIKRKKKTRSISNCNEVCAL